MSRLGRLRRIVAVALPLLVALGVALTDPAAWAAPAPPKPTVIFFAGFASTDADMRLWLAAARGSIPYGQDFDFDAIPYPKGASVVERDALRASGTTINAVAQRIAAAPDHAFIVVGHSSGAALAAAVVQKIGDRRNIRLVILDDGVDEGFTPPRGFDAATQVECWSVVNGPLVSFNRNDTRAFCRNYHEMQAPGCRSDYCLHFAIVNLNASRDMTLEAAFASSPTGISGGYQNLKINLDWLNSSIRF